MAEDPDVVSRRIARESLDRDDPTGWFEQLYSAAADGAAVVPWDRGTAHPLLIEWIDEADPDAANGNDFPDQGESLGLFSILPDDGQADAGTLGPADFADRVD